jgi:Phage tail lysozyme
MTDPVELIDRQTQLANFLVAGWPTLDIPGLPAISAAAAVGNATQENQCRSVTPGPLDHGSDGLFQWRLDRLTNMQNFGNKNFGGWQSIEAQAAFFSFECKGWYKPLWNDLAAGLKALATLTANICDQYEKPNPALANLDARIKYATDFMNVWKPELHQGDIATPPAPVIAAPPAPAPTAPPSTAITMDADVMTAVSRLADAALAPRRAALIAKLAAILREV